jgi:hypothetical protein
MANHIKYIKDITSWPLEKIVQAFVIQKLNKSPENGHSNGYVILDVRSEQIELKGGTKKKVHRVFIQSNDSGSYSKTGWIVRDDMDSCMICAKALNHVPTSSFSLFSSANKKTVGKKNHCRACGNIVCEDCGGTKAIVYPMIEMPSRVCILCNYGQFPVDPIPNDTLGVSLFSESSSSSTASSIQTEGLTSLTPSKKLSFPSSLLSPLKNSPLKSNSLKKKPFSSPKGSPSRFFTSSNQKAKPIEPLIRRTDDLSSVSSVGASATNQGNPRSPYEDLLEMNDEEFENSIYEELDCYYDPYPTQNIRLYDYGRMELCRIKPVFVLRAFYCDETFVFINLTECDDVPYHHHHHSSKGDSEKKSNKKEIFCIVYGEQMIAHNGIPTIDCAVNGQLIQEAKNDPSRLHEVIIPVLNLPLFY